MQGTLVTSDGRLLPGWLVEMSDHVLPLPYGMLVRPCIILAAGAVTALWTIRVWLRSVRSGVVVWTASLGMVWDLLDTLLMPWVNGARSYRPLFQAVKPVLQSAQICVATYGTGENEHALMCCETDVRPAKWLLDRNGTGDDHRPDPIVRACDLILVFEKRPEYARHHPHDDD